jgi:hypothetical protein
MEPCPAERRPVAGQVVAILIPVLDRPHRIRPLLANIAETTPEPHTVLFAASDLATVCELQRLGAPHLWDDGDTWPNRINMLFHATTQPYVFLGADDVLFHPGWLSTLLEAQRHTDGVAVPADLHNPNGTLPLVSRRYVDEESLEPGVVVHPGYGHNYSDTELFAIARKRGRYTYCPGAVVEHLHPCAGKGEMDATYEKGYATLDADAALYEMRQHLWA